MNDFDDVPKPKADEHDVAEQGRATCLSGHFPHLPPTPKALGRAYVPAAPTSGTREVEDLTARPPFGWLKIIKFIRRGSTSGAVWNGECVAPTGPGGAPCGRHRLVGEHALRRGEARSCGAQECRSYARRETARAGDAKRRNVGE